MANLSQAERTWFATHTTGTTSQTPLNDIKRRYFISEIGGASADIKSLGDLESQWLRKAITDAGGTPVSTGYTSELWRQLVGALNLTVSKYEPENRLTFYLNAA